MQQGSEKNRPKKSKPHKAITATECMKVVKIDIDFFGMVLTFGKVNWKKSLILENFLNSETSARNNFI